MLLFVKCTQCKTLLPNILTCLVQFLHFIAILLIFSAHPMDNSHNNLLLFAKYELLVHFICIVLTKRLHILFYLVHLKAIAVFFILLLFSKSCYSDKSSMLSGEGGASSKWSVTLHEAPPSRRAAPPSQVRKHGDPLPPRD